MEKEEIDDTVCIEVLVKSDTNYAQNSCSKSPSKYRKRKQHSLLNDDFRKKARVTNSNKNSSTDKCFTKRSKSAHSTKGKVSLDPSEVQNVLDEMDEDIDNVLEETAEKNQLTTSNVKNILRHVITNEYVLAMVRNTMKSESNECDDLEDAIFEPKLTRSKVKELQEKNHMLPWPVSTPVKQPEVASKVLLDGEFLDESSDDEDYKPNEEEFHSDDDNTTLSPKSTDFDTSYCVKAMSPAEKVIDDDENALVIALPEPESEDLSVNVEADKIALRTRSKLPLNDTPLELIEASFIAPDITVDMYDTHCDDEEWQQFLRELSKPIDIVAIEKPDEEPDDAEDDPEYNVLEEDDIPDEFDLRYDNTMKITRKELNALMAEIMESVQNDYEDDLDEDEVVDLPRSENCESKPLSTSEECDKVVMVRAEWMIHTEKIQLDEQMRMYVQLLTQSYLLSIGIPELNYINISTKLFLDEMKMFAALNTTIDKRSAFYAYNLDGALDIVNQYESGKFADEHHPRIRNSRGFSNINSIAIKNTMFNSKVFIYPELLPMCNFHKSLESKKAIFTMAEDNLIALGLEQFSFSPTPIYYINTFLLPTKTECQIKLRIKNSKCPKVSLQNPIKYYFEYKHAPPLPKMIRQFDPDNVRPPKDFPPEYLPHWMRIMCDSTLNPPAVVPILPKSVIVRPSSKKLVIKQSAVPKVYKIMPRNVQSPLKQLSPILKKYNQKRLVPASSGCNNTLTTRKSVQFSKRLLAKSPIRVLNSANTNEGNNSDNMSLSKAFCSVSPLSSDVKNIKSNAPSVTTETTVMKSTDMEHKMKRGIESECAINLDGKIYDVPVEPEVPDIDDEEIVDYEQESTIQPQAASNTVIKKQQSTSKKKNKQQRDLESTLILLQPNLLKNDPKKEEREALFANSYLLRVTEALKSDADTFEKFLKVLCRYQHCAKSPIKLYLEIKDILKDYPRLVEDFIAFLHPEQAIHCGKYKEYIILSKIRQFIRKVEVHFRNQPQNLLKILKTFAQFRQQSGITSAEVLATLQPLLKNQSHLMEELSSLLPDVAPPEHLMTDFEDITIPNSDDDNSSIDSCEEIVIPDVPDPYGGKDCPCNCHKSSTEAKVLNKTKHCVKCGIKFIDGKVYIQTGKVLKPAQVTYHEIPPDSIKVLNNDSKIPSKSKQSNTCLKNPVVTEQHAKAQEISQPKKDLVIPISVIQQNLNHSEDPVPSTSKLPCDIIEDTVFPTVSNCTNKKSDPSDFSRLKDIIGQSKDKYNPKHNYFSNKSNSTNSSTASVEVLDNANQTIQWSREEDKLIIYNFQRFGLTDRSFQSSAIALENRSPEQVQERFFHLMECLSKEMKL